MMHLTLTCEMYGSWIVQHILNSLRMAIITCYLLSGSRVSFVCHFGSITLMLSGTPKSGVWSENNRVMLPKSRMEDTRVRNQITHNSRYSYTGLGLIHLNKVLTCHLSFLTLCISFHSIENSRWPTSDVRWIQWKWCTLCRMVSNRQRFPKASFC
jgi:hypothetical protein